MKLFWIGLFLTWGSTCLLADSLVCTAGGGPNIVPCSSSPLQITAQFPTLDIAGNTISVNPELSFGVGTATLPQLNVSVAGTINDTLALPNSPAGDVLKVSAGYGFDQNEVNATSSFAFQIGPGNASSPEINLNRQCSRLHIARREEPVVAASRERCLPPHFPSLQSRLPHRSQPT